MDVHQTRQKNLELLAEELSRPGRLKKDVALDLGLSPSFFSQLMHGKLMGSDVARGIEKYRGLAPGWMDHAHVRIGEETGWYAPSQSVGFDLDILQQAFELIELVLPITGDPPSLAKDPKVLNEAYLLVAKAMARKEQWTLLSLAPSFAARLRELRA